MKKRRKWKAWFENGLARKTPLMVTDDDMKAVQIASSICRKLGWDIMESHLGRMVAAMDTWKHMPKNMEIRHAHAALDGQPQD